MFLVACACAKKLTTLGPSTPVPLYRTRLRRGYKVLLYERDEPITNSDGKVLDICPLTEYIVINEAQPHYSPQGQTHETDSHSRVLGLYDLWRHIGDQICTGTGQHHQRNSSRKVRGD